jgi:ABC-type transport system involved in multi-copper enzyme maturation permease subunit
MLQRLPFTRRISLPLLAKELVEQSARPRTYVIRTAYAVLLFVAAGLMFHDTLRRFTGANPFAVLGQGREMFDILIGLQFAGVYLFMPAITCGVLTQEKERDSLALLFLTRLGPWAILFEKLLSRLVPMFTFLLLSLPLMVFAYSLGGISAARLWGGVVVVSVTAIQIGCLALACSAYFRTTVAAFVGTYLIGLAMMFGIPLTYFVIRLMIFHDVPEPRFASWLIDYLGPNSSVAAVLREFCEYTGMLPYNEPVALFSLVGPIVFFPFDMPWMPGRSGANFFAYVLRTIPMLMSSGVCLVMARAFVVRRAFVPAKNPLLRVFKKLDGLFQRFNQNRITKGIVLINEEDSLPETEPVAWRETSKRALGMKRYLIRLFLALELPVILVCMLISAAGGGGDMFEAGAAVMFVLWAISVLIVSVKSASLIASERTHQTLDVLISTPMSAREIVQQKFRGVRRLLLLLSIPFITLILFEVAWRSAATPNWLLSDVNPNTLYGYYRRATPAALYLVSAVLSVGIYLPMIAWLSLWIGLWTRSQARAIIGALAAIVGWCVLPFLFIILPIEIIFGGQALSSQSPLCLLTLFSPATIVVLTEVNELQEVGRAPWLAVLLNFVFYVPCLVVFRLLCLNFADRCLDRNEHGTTIAERRLETPQLATGGTGQAAT